VESKEEEKKGPTRLIVRDAHIDKEKMDREGYIKNGIFQFELKTENSLNRITSAANPRPMERVPKGTQFNFEMVYSIYDMGDSGEIDIEYLDFVFSALKLVEASALGGGGSRGSGEVRFMDKKARIKKVDDYRKEAEGAPEEPGTLINLEGQDGLDKLKLTLQNLKPGK
jgi:CRISPR-associated protein Csm3